jgi:hypothetical protein
MPSSNPSSPPAPSYRSAGAGDAPSAAAGTSKPALARRLSGLGLAGRDADAQQVKTGPQAATIPET